MMQDNETKHHGDLPITHEMKLSLVQWITALAVVALVAFTTPRIWKNVERFDSGADYRIPYQLSKDYWLFDRYLEKITAAKSIVVLGDSVVWGEYVKAVGTLSHFLDAEAGTPRRFANAGVNGLFPLAMEGLVRYYGKALHGRKVIIVCNMLWLSSARADMQSAKIDSVNHASLLPQFFPRIPAYQPDANVRLGAVITRQIAFMQWAGHLQDAYFNQRSITQWTMDEDPNRPRCYPNSYSNPLARVKLSVPSGVGDDAERGEGSRRHKPWNSDGQRRVAFEWVGLESSLQWAAFRRTVELLRARGNDVFVVMAPFNEHMIEAGGLAVYSADRAGILAWLNGNHVPYVGPDTLPSDLYADASHPLTAGYEALARQILHAESFRTWMLNDGL